MKSTIFKIMCVLLIFHSAFMLSPLCSADAKESEILKRLEQMEQEINQLKKENADLRSVLQQEIKAKKAENSQLRAMVAHDRKAIEELKKSAGRVSRTSELNSVFSRYHVQVYGRVKVDLNYDTAEFRKYNDFLGAVGIGDSENDSTNFNPRDTRIGFKFSRRDNQWFSEARIENDFYGDNNGNNLIPRMRLGYVRLTNDDWQTSLLVGQDWTPIAQLNPPTIDFGLLAGAGNLWWRIPQVTLRKKIGNIELLASAMKHRRTSTAEEDRLPWMLGRVAYTNGILGRGGLIALGGGWKSESLKRNAFGKDNKVDRWLVALELRLKFGKFTLAAEPWIGEGIDKEWLRYDMGINPHDTRPHKRPDTIRSRGGWASLTCAMSQRLTFSLGYGIDDAKNSDMDGMDLNDRQFTKNEMYFFNTWYEVTSSIKMGFEVMHLETERFSDVNNGTRFTCSTIYSF